MSLCWWQVLTVHSMHCLIIIKMYFLHPTNHLFFSVFPPSVDNMSEVTSLHDSSEPRGRGGRSQPPALGTVYDQDEAMSTISSVSQHAHRRDDYPRRGGGYMGDRIRARSMDNLDDIGRRRGRDDYPPHRRPDEPRGRRGWVIVVASLLPWTKLITSTFLFEQQVSKVEFSSQFWTTGE